MTAVESRKGPDRGGAVDPTRVAELLRAVIAVGADLDLEGTLQRIVEGAASLVGARYGSLELIEDAGARLGRSITAGIDAVRPGRAATFLRVPVRVGDEVVGSLQLRDRIAGGPFTDTDAQLATALAVAAGVAIDHARLFGRAERDRQALAAVHEVATAFIAGTDPREMLQLVAGHARALVAADLATIALPLPDGETMIIEVADGLDASVIGGQRFPRDGSISGLVLHSGETAVLDDASKDAHRVQPQVEGGHFGPTAFVALRAEGQPFGTLSLARHTGGAPFTPAELALIETFAAHASAVVGRERDRGQQAQLLVLSDQERIARNLHDTVIQRLFAAGLSLQAGSRRSEEVAKSRMVEVVEELDAVINTIRTVIFDVHAGLPTRPRQQVLDLTREMAPVLGLEPSVIFAGPVDTVVDPGVAHELLATLREGLSNVARHAGAASVQVEVRAEAGSLALLVRDDGVGRLVHPSTGHVGLGLDNMAARAEQLGGAFMLEHPAGGGTLLSWKVPYG